MEKKVVQYLKLLKIPVSQNFCERLILSHPEQYSLLSIADTFERLGIPHKIFRTKLNSLKSISFPYLIQLEKDHAELILIQNNQDLKSKQDDLKYWKGVVIVARPIKDLMDKSNSFFLSIERKKRNYSILLCLSVMALLLLLVMQHFSPINIALLFSAIAGCVIGYLLIAKDLGTEFKPITSFCNRGGVRASCDQVLRSHQAQIFKNINLSEIVLSYFIFQIIIIGILMPIIQNVTTFFPILSVLSFTTVPIMIYTLYLQYFVLEYWCKLCLLVDLILTIQFGIFLSINL